MAREHTVFGIREPAGCLHRYPMTVDACLRQNKWLTLRTENFSYFARQITLPDAVNRGDLLLIRLK